MNTTNDYLYLLADVIKDSPVNLTEQQVLDLLQIKFRWPVDSVETINQYQKKSTEYYDSRGFLIYERWKRLYDVGFTSILCNVLDLTQELRDLQDRLRLLRGSETNGNLYFTKGTRHLRASYDLHAHDYDVVVKIIYGSSLWQIGEQRFSAEPGDILVIPQHTPHCVLENPEPRLTLTLNMTG